MNRRRLALALTVLLVVVGAAGWVLRPRQELPPALAGGLVFVSDRDGIPSLYWRRLPRDQERRLTFGSEPAGEPAVSPDGTRVAFSLNGRVAVVAVASGEEEVLTFGVEWVDAEPAWMPDGRRLVISARRGAEAAGLHLLAPGADGVAARHPLTRPRSGDDTEPAPSPDGTFVAFVREDHLFRVALADGQVTRLTGGFRNERSPRFLPDGRIVCAWSEGKSHGIDVLDANGEARETVLEGSVVYRTVSPSPDGRFLAATFNHDLAFDPLRALLLRRKEEVHLLAMDGGLPVILESSLLHASHSPDWGP
jgi:Tol biopolymer transport system component